MTATEIYNDIQGLENLIYKINKREPLALKELNRLHRIAFGERVTADCSNCHIKAYKKLLSLTILDLENMQNQQFKIKKDALIEYPFRSGQFYSSKSGIEDNIAIAYLSQFPKLIKNFETYPGSESESKELDLSSFEEPEVQAEEDLSTEKSLEKMNKSELQAKFLEIKGVEAEESLTKKELIALIEA